MISYQLFTDTAVKTIMMYIGYHIPSMGYWSNQGIEMIVFIYAFAWIFVLSSVLPGVILGKNGSVLVQFFVCLALTFVSFMIQGGLISLINIETMKQILDFSVLFENPYVAIMYLSLPFLIMLSIDIHSRRSNRLNTVFHKLSRENEDSEKFSVTSATLQKKRE